jgi:hypothetical protein
MFDFFEASSRLSSHSRPRTDDIPYANFWAPYFGPSVSSIRSWMMSSWGYSPARLPTTTVYDKSQLRKAPDNTLNKRRERLIPGPATRSGPRGGVCPYSPDFFNEEGVMVGGTGSANYMSVLGGPDKQLVISQPMPHSSRNGTVQVMFFFIFKMKVCGYAFPVLWKPSTNIFKLSY